MMRYSPSRNYRTASAVALGLAGCCVWFGLSWSPAWIAVVLFLLSGALLAFLALLPPIEVHSHYLRVGKRAIPWGDIRRVDRTGWISPLIVKLALVEEQVMTLVYPGDLDSSNALLQSLRRAAHHALIDGVPYQEFWGTGDEASPMSPEGRKQLASPKYKLLLEEDEADVERLYQRLKTVGHLDSKEES